jgi:hypothetical protein
LFAPSQAKLATTLTIAFPPDREITKSMSQKRAPKRRLSSPEEPEGKRRDRKASPQGDVFNTDETAAGDADGDTYESEVSFSHLDNPLPRRSLQPNNP